MLNLSMSVIINELNSNQRFCFNFVVVVVVPRFRRCHRDAKETGATKMSVKFSIVKTKHFFLEQIAN